MHAFERAREFGESGHWSLYEFVGIFLVQWGELDCEYDLFFAPSFRNSLPFFTAESGILPMAKGLLVVL